MEANPIEVAKAVATQWGYLAAGFGAAITVVGAGLGIGKLALQVRPFFQLIRDRGRRIDA